ncbi:2'-5' RNA ligase family protein [Actinospica sp. MGRD01-02]|uniref:2'-5' RNA ligase family protein n=1 Tax=Actinospica acidithermotolerans TaxID=2828514 RepID=A0A941EGC0_9ACTN|nr:2'-5' RNA ligase family protein [Actinospica acidithermotolerans]MBR7830942.1 2'-5' RNA ligase family protein [Actinospica acidithermotolerans]
MTTIGISLEIPEPYGTGLRDRRASYGDPQAEFVPTHVTLLPPTEVDAEVLPEVEEHLEKVAGATAPFRMLLAGTGTFLPVSPVVFVQISRGLAECEALEAKVRDGVLERDLKFPYHPHVTVAHDLDEPHLEFAMADLADYQAEFDLDRLKLYEQCPDGTWQVLREFAFEDAEA